MGNKKKSQKTCKHLLRKKMTWPDNGTSELCTECLKTRYHTEFDKTEWQDHGYITEADWYKESYVLALKMYTSNPKEIKMGEIKENFNEECWVIYGYRWFGDMYGLEIYESIGSPGSVDFNWERVIKNAEIVLGFNHSHPEGFLSPSDIDDVTMIGWVKALGKPLLCGIKSGDEQKIYLYERINGEVDYREIPFKKTGKLIMTRSWI